MSRLDRAEKRLSRAVLKAFGESLQLKTLSGERREFKGTFSGEEILLDELETTGYIVSTPINQWQGSHPRRNKATITRIKTGVEYDVYNARVRGSDLIISLIG
ncbi:hypothetical protein [Pseudoalteromonas umbrosa]|uniref:hypothetical protein n=1 Tax=Pseudoalteromonas umbrosa TaxID=3048489 RepID=UPI0024C46CDF|nr:hypothetical protein [Pseudoalteromonas sp. B95]MDK1289784.1 hypothetical protein [Pseudoalteromonas sp. B95]